MNPRKYDIWSDDEDYLHCQLLLHLLDRVSDKTPLLNTIVHGMNFECWSECLDKTRGKKPLIFKFILTVIEILRPRVCHSWNVGIWRSAIEPVAPGTDRTGWGNLVTQPKSRGAANDFMRRGLL